jgi:hypothetical protein
LRKGWKRCPDAATNQGVDKFFPISAGFRHTTRLLWI